MYHYINVEECKMVGVSNPLGWLEGILKQIRSWSRKEDESPVSLVGTLQIGFLVGQACVMHQHSKLKLDATFIDDFNLIVNRQINTNEEMEKAVSEPYRIQMYLNHAGFYSEVPAWMVFESALKENAFLQKYLSSDSMLSGILHIGMRAGELRMLLVLHKTLCDNQTYVDIANQVNVIMNELVAVDG
jgi:hypothetical protein